MKSVRKLDGSLAVGMLRYYCMSRSRQVVDYVFAKNPSVCARCIAHPLQLRSQRAALAKTQLQRGQCSHINSVAATECVSHLLRMCKQDICLCGRAEAVHHTFLQWRRKATLRIAYSRVELLQPQWHAACSAPPPPPQPRPPLKTKSHPQPAPKNRVPFEGPFSVGFGFRVSRAVQDALRYQSRRDNP